MITKDQIKEGTTFKHLGDKWIVDSIEEQVFQGTTYLMVRTSIVGGKKGNYRTELNDLVEYLNETNSELV